MSWGLELSDTDTDPKEVGALGRDLEAAGFSSVWAGETACTDAIAILAMLGAATSRLKVGTAVLPVYTRTPGMLAMSASTLARAFPGRAFIGIGASSAFIAERWNGVPFERPFARVRDTFHFLRAALAGEKVSQTYDSFAIRGFRLSPPPDQPPPLLIGATGPRMIDFALDETDGVVLNWLTAEDIASLVADHAGERRVYTLLTAFPSEDRERVYAQARPFVAQYLSVPAYAGLQRRFGRGERLAPVWEAWNGGDYKAAAAALEPELIDELVVHGSPASCREQIAEFTRVSGATPLVIPMGDHAPMRERALSLAPDAG